MLESKASISKFSFIVNQESSNRKSFRFYRSYSLIDESSFVFLKLFIHLRSHRMEHCSEISEIVWSLSGHRPVQRSVR